MRVQGSRVVPDPAPGPLAQFWDAEGGRTIHTMDVSRTPILNLATARAGSHLVALTSTGSLQYAFAWAGRRARGGGEGGGRGRE